MVSGGERPVSRASETIAQRAKDLAIRLEEVIKSSGETSATRQTVVLLDDVPYVAQVEIKLTRKP